MSLLSMGVMYQLAAAIDEKHSLMRSFATAPLLPGMLSHLPQGQSRSAGPQRPRPSYRKPIRSTPHSRCFHALPFDPVATEQRSAVHSDQAHPQQALAASDPWAGIRDALSRISFREGLVRPLRRLICWLALASHDCYLVQSNNNPRNPLQSLKTY